MKVFISWSGAASREVAEVLADWLPKVLQGLEPFVSAKDIDKGANWTVELARELEDAQFGIICLAPDNLLSPWLNYEAGAITKSVNSRVCPVLLGVQKSEVRPPIAQLQMTSFDIDDFTLLMNSMNKVAGETLTLPSVQEAVSVWWPMLQSAIGAIVVPQATASNPERTQEPEQPESSGTEMLTELLQRVRQMDARLSRAEETRARVPSSKKNSIIPQELLGVLARNGLTVNRVASGMGGMSISLNGPLPGVIGGEVAQEVGEFAKAVESSIRLIGEDRTVTFSPSGFADEPPF